MASPFDSNRSQSESMSGDSLDLFTAASLGDLNLVMRFLQSPDCSVDMRNASGWTALMYAAHHGHYHVIRGLLQQGADVSLSEPNHGCTALMLAASNGHTRCVEMLVNQGKADITHVDHSGNTASFYATHFGHGSNNIIARILAIRSNQTYAPTFKTPHSVFNRRARREIPRAIFKSPSTDSGLGISCSPSDCIVSAHLIPPQVPSYTSSDTIVENAAASIMRQPKPDTVDSSFARPFETNYSHSSRTSNAQNSEICRDMELDGANVWRTTGTRRFDSVNSAGESNPSSPASPDSAGSSERFDSFSIESGEGLSMAQVLTRLNLQQYVPLFRKRMITFIFFLDMSASQLSEIGIADRTHLQTLLDEQAKQRALHWPGGRMIIHFHEKLLVLESGYSKLESYFLKLAEGMDQLNLQMNQLEQKLSRLSHKMGKTTNDIYSVL